MKKPKAWEITLLVLLTALFTFALMSCTKEPIMYDDPEPYLIHDKTVKFEGQKRVGETIKFWVNMPAPYTNDLQWYFNYGSSEGWSQGIDTIYHTYNKSGVYYVKVVGWSSDHTKQGLSNAAKLQILD